jgi:hypothetical protein
MANAPRDCYRYDYKIGNKIRHSGFTTDPERREKEHQRRWPGGHLAVQRPSSDRRYGARVGKDQAQVDHTTPQVSGLCLLTEAGPDDLSRLADTRHNFSRFCGDRVLPSAITRVSVEGFDPAPGGLFLDLLQRVEAFHFKD